MSRTPNIPNVGAMDPELRNSVVAEEFAEESDTVQQEVPGDAVCYFNGQAFDNESYVRSGDRLLKCRYGVWIETGPGDPQNP
jgi:hypothetical protein